MNNLAYRKIKDFYGSRYAKRSNVLLMKHIDEGLLILDYFNASNYIKDAFCLHPLFQDTNQLLLSIEDLDYNEINSKTLILVMEYRHVANSFLSNKSKNNVLPFINRDIQLLLIADKIQNYKDFLKYHKGTHKNSVRLEEYFQEWFDILNIDYNSLVSKIFKNIT